MSTRDLINAIAAGDAIEIENAFNSVMAEKVSARIDDMRIDVAQNLFAEEQIDELSKTTLKSYVKKSAASAQKHAVAAQDAEDRAYDDPDDDEASQDAYDHREKEDKRMAGIKTANKKLDAKK